MLRYAVLPILLTCAVCAHAACPATERGPAAVKAAALAYDADAISQLFDVGALAARVANGMPSDTTMVSGLRAGIEASRAQLGTGLFGAIKASGMHLADQPAPGGRTVLRKETDTLTGGVDYLDFTLDGAGCIIDVESVMLGSSTSAVMRQMLAATLGDGNALTRMLGIDTSEKIAPDVLQQLAAAVRGGDHRKVAALIEAMPDAYRDSFEFSMLRVGMLAQIDPQSSAYALALQDVERVHGKDERTRYMLIDRYYLSKRYDQALAAIDALQRRVGVDPQNQALRGSLLFEMRRGEEAVAAMRKLVELEPKRSEAHDLLIGVAVQLGRHEDALAAIDGASAALNVEFSHELLASDPTYAALLESPQYKQWRRAQAD